MSTAAIFGTDISEKDAWPSARTILRRASVSWPQPVESDAIGITFVDERTEWLIAAYKKLACLAALADDWNSYGADAPSQESIDIARGILRLLADADFEPTSVDASAEGGVCLSFHQDGRYGDIECFNSGLILAVISTGGDDTSVWEIGGVGPQLHSALSKIRTFVAR